LFLHARFPSVVFHFSSFLLRRYLRVRARVKAKFTPTRLLRLSLLDLNSSRDLYFVSLFWEISVAGNSDYYCEHRAFYCMLGFVSGSLRRNGNSTRGSFSSFSTAVSRRPPLSPVCSSLFRRCIRSSNDRIHLPEHRTATSRRVRGGKRASRVHFRGAGAENYARLWTMNDKLCAMYIYQP